MCRKDIEATWLGNRRRKEKRELLAIDEELGVEVVYRLYGSHLRGDVKEKISDVGVEGGVTELASALLSNYSSSALVSRTDCRIASKC